MEFRTIDLTILSANNLNHVNFFSKTGVYAVVSILDSNSTLFKQKTSVDKHGGKNPTWNYPITAIVSDVALFNNQITAVFQLYSKRFFPVDKLIGEVRVPVSDFISGGDDREQKPNILSYQVRSKSGKPKGVLNFKCKIGEKFQGVGVGPSVSQGGPAMAYPYAHPPPMTGYPPPPLPPPQQQAGYGHGYPGYGMIGNPYSNGYGQRMGGLGGRNNFGMGLGAGLLGGALGGMLIGDMMSDAAFDGGFDGGGFDF